MAITLGVIAGGIRVAAADVVDPFSYQSLTNLGPCASSRVLLMNNDTNETCPIEGQGYHDTSNTVAVGQTYWWHDDTPNDESINTSIKVADWLNLQNGIHHILYQKKDDGIAPVKLWELINCRAGSSASRYATTFNYLPWSSNCQPIDSAYSAPINPSDYTAGVANSNGIKQVAVVTMRASLDAAVYSPFYEDGIGVICFDAVNFLKASINSHLAVEIATGVKETGSEEPEVYDSETSYDKLNWQRLKCEVYIVKDGKCEIDDVSNGNDTVLLRSQAGYDKEYFRVRVNVNYKGPIRFRIVRTDLWNSKYKDYYDILFLDNIIASYPTPKATLTPTGIDSEGTGFAKIGRVGAFTEPLLSRGLESAVPRMTFSVETNSLPQLPFINWNVSVTNSDFVWRWHYLNQAYGPWSTNKMSVAGDWLVGDSPISVTNRIGDIEYYYVADVAGTHYKFYDFANDKDKQIPLPEAESDSSKVRYPDATVEGVTNYWSRIREGVSPWQEMHLEATVITNSEKELAVTNDWTMELISDHTWRGFVFTPTNYAGKVANIRFVGRNMWETNGVTPKVDSKIWYFPQGEIREIPMGGVASGEIPAKEQDIVLDATSGYLMFEFNDQSGAFIMNRAEYQDFNKWMPSLKYNGGAAEENKYIGSFVNTSYVGSAKQEYTLDVGNWPMSRSTSAYWWENFDSMAGNADYPFNEPFGLNRMTPNGWTASNGMFINGMFYAVTNTTTIGMALQMQGRGLGTLSLIDPGDIPQGIGTVSFSARLAQYLEFGDFYYYEDGTTKTNYAISAKVAMTNRRKKFSDVSTGSPSLSLVAYYRYGHGCYEFRVTRISATSSEPTSSGLWDNTGKMEIAIYKWHKAIDPDLEETVWASTKLSSVIYTDSEKNYLVPNDSGTNVIDNANWSSMYFAAYTAADGKSTYLEGGIATKANNKTAYADFSTTSKNMHVVKCTDTNAPLTRGSYGVGTRECPGTFGSIHYHVVTGAGPYKDTSSGSFSTGKFKSCPEGNATQENSWRWILRTLSDGAWGSASPNRIIRWEDCSDKDYYSGTFNNGLCAAPVSQKLYLKTSPVGSSNKGEHKDWTDTGLDLTLTNYLPVTEVFSPRTTKPVNIQISVGGKQSSPRTDVVIDDIQLSQWAGDSSQSSDLGSTTMWAFTDGWISATTNDVYDGTGSVSEDEVANISSTNYYVKQVSDTEYVYVFTNTSKEISFVPKFDMIVKELFVLGAGGGGGPGGGGGGGGGAIWVTNDVEYVAGEAGIKIKVGAGGGGGSVSYSDNKVQPTGGGNGGDSYVYLKNPLKPTSTEQYRGYGGYRGGLFRDSNDAGAGSTSGGGAGGGSARTNATRAAGREIYAAGFGGAAMDGAPGGGGGGGLRGVDPSKGSNAAESSGTSVIYAGSNGTDGYAGAYGGQGGDGFPLEALGESEVRDAIGDLLGDDNAWLGGGGGGGSGTNTAANATKWGEGALNPGLGGEWSGGAGGLFTAGTYSNPTKAMGAAGRMFTGGGGGGGSYNVPVSSGSNTNKNWIIGGGKGGDGLVVMHVKVKDRFVMLQPMRGEEGKPMSIRTPFLKGISLLAFSWKDAHSNAVLKVQIATNDVNSGNIRNISESLGNLWSDFGEPISFADMDDARRAQGSTNIIIGLRAPVSGIVRLLVDPALVATARQNAADSEFDSLYGTVIITGMKVFDEPELDDRSWWGWNIMPTKEEKWSSLYDPVTLGPGRSLGLNFSGVLSANDLKKGSNPDYDPEFAEDPVTAEYHKHDPFVQTPRFTNHIGAVMFKARVQETNLTSSGWVTISASTDPGKEEENDANWVVLTNIEVTAGTTVFEPFLWRIPTSQSNYQALRLTTWGAAEGRYNSEESGKPFGDPNVTTNPTPIQRVLIDEVVVTQPMAPKLQFVNAYPFRDGTTDEENKPILNIDSPDQQPVLNETFGMQVQVLPAGMEDELDKSSIKVYMAWYAGEKPWGYEKWKNEKNAVKCVELKRAGDEKAQRDPENLVFRSNPKDAAAFIPPQQAGEFGYQVVQYHIWAEYENKNGIKHTHVLSDRDWTLPSWYFGITDFNKVNNDFCAYTVLDTISPKRAWINEINTFDGDTRDDKCQFIEVAVPQGFDMTGWSLQSIKNDMYKADGVKNVAYFGYNGVVPHKTANATNSYAFIALQSPNTKAAGRYQSHGLNDGSWGESAFEKGIVQVSEPYALLLKRPTGIIEHALVFMSTNIWLNDSRPYLWEGSNHLENLKNTEIYKNHDWVYAGADAYGERLNSSNKKFAMSLGVYTNHGENASFWSNMMRQTPGKVNITADGMLQTIDPDYFKPPSGTNLWIYASIEPGSINSLSMVIGDVTNTSAVIIVPQVSGTFSTSIVYVVKKWFELDKVVTNEYGKASGAVKLPADIKDRRVWTLDLNGLEMSDPENRKFEVMASVKDSSQIAALGDKGIAKDDPYYPAVVDWLQEYDEGTIRLAEIWLPNDKKVTGADGEVSRLNLKQMYWLNIPPVSQSAKNTTTNESDWVFKGGMGTGAIPWKEVKSYGVVTNIRVGVTMMISNRFENTAHAPNVLRGLEPGSTSSNYNEKVSGDWNSVTFKITGALQNGKVNKVYRPLRWFTFGPDSFTNGFTRVVDVPDPFSPRSAGYSYEWWKHPECNIFYRWRIDHDTNRPPDTVYQLNDENALLEPRSN